MNPSEAFSISSQPQGYNSYLTEILIRPIEASAEAALSMFLPSMLQPSDSEIFPGYLFTPGRPDPDLEYEQAKPIELGDFSPSMPNVSWDGPELQPNYAVEGPAIQIDSGFIGESPVLSQMPEAATFVSTAMIDTQTISTPVTTA